jgi:hypothetical protein
MRAVWAIQVAALETWVVAAVVVAQLVRQAQTVLDMAALELQAQFQAQLFITLAVVAVVRV